MLEKRTGRSSDSPNQCANDGGTPGFPETCSTILRRAAQGDWEPFLQEYLRPCWREIVIRCHQQNIQLTDVDDLFQELVLRLFRNGRLKVPEELDPDERRELAEVRGNIPARHLAYQQLSLHSARFRTVLKAVIRNLILESHRGRAKQPHSLTGDVVDPGPRVEESVSDSVERLWMGQCLDAAAEQLYAESRDSPTKGARRLFAVLYRSTVLDESPGLIATDFHVDRTTISGLLTQARHRFIRILRDTTDLQDDAELVAVVRRMPDRLSAALERANALDPSVEKQQN